MNKTLKKIKVKLGAWVAPSVKHLTLDVSSGLDLRVVSLNPTLGSMFSMEPALKKKKKSQGIPISE